MNLDNHNDPARNPRPAPNTGPATPLPGQGSLRVYAPISPGAREVLAEHAVKMTLRVHNEPLWRYLLALAVRANLSGDVYTNDPLCPGRSTQNFIEMMEIRALLSGRNGERFPVFHLQLGEAILAFSTTTTELSRSDASNRGAGMLFANPDYAIDLMECEFANAARGTEAELRVPLDVIHIIRLQPAECVEAVKVIRTRMFDCVA